METHHDDIPEQALAWHEAGIGSALATVVETWGSAPRRVGAQLAVSGEGGIAGSVSGGCVEGAVVVEAQEAIADGAPRLLEFGVSDDEAFAVGLACGGRIRVLLEPIVAERAESGGLPVGILRQIIDRRTAGRAHAYLVDTVTWTRRVVTEDGADEGLNERFRLDRSGFEGAEFVAIGNPPLRLVVVGGVHIAQALLSMADTLGYASCVIDPRESFANAERFPGRHLVHDWPDAALKALAPDHRTAIITLTHDPKLDDPAILAALESDAFYIGCLGSTRTHAKRVARLRAAGVSEEGIARINAPLGLDIGAASPAEIALSALAELTRALRRGP
ncbi:XdhC/CoxI family protein [Brevirhabdus pacifica]|uniref:XdhC/CoxI family protein n=1 Tax=Brevirhabdus pacifica TaxID=1267768 RepID=A0A1U7DL23_9RHOB|nr:XdhC family protein [Brevirhabdus pacifica]APX90671.1 XdhC/CoxI family protein [Brevirhabdus pacifica]OWU78347.1 XdhC/CoxI family protein [Loktanella sp. 22II-4b]PJJ85181.1 xanthine dehydrogenase accessory factor [Brevirhabdus pacifica]